ncbi:MAG: hypothetical protein ABIH28_01890 [archaeon]
MEKGVILSLVVIILLISVVSAEIIINEQPKEVYNLGDTILVPAKVKSLTDTYGILQMNLVCNGKETNFYRNGISLAAGEEKDVEALIPLIEDIIGEPEGICKIKVSLLKEYILTEDFRISDLIEVKASTNKNSFNPEEEISITGNATKESKSELNGFVEITFSKEGSIKLKQTEIISNGKFLSKIKIPKTMEAGKYVVTLTAYEKDSQEKITNKGFVNYILDISQIPTNLEIFFEQKEVNPGESLKVKAILRDQTGGKINSSAVISIKDDNNKILEQIEEKTDSFIGYKIKEQQLPSEWKVIAISNKITSESTFRIKEQEKINIEIINKTVVLTNTGNVFYNKTVFVKIGEEPFNINATLKIGESKKYSLNAPEGEYLVRILSPEGEEVERSVALTGGAISVEEISKSAINLARHPFVWVFILVVLGFVAFSLFRKEHKKNFFGYFSSKKHKNTQPEEKISSYKNSLVSPTNRANLSLSIKGENQKSSIVCIKIKNHIEIALNKSNAKDVLQKITEMAERAKAYVYESNDCLFFLLAPMITKTFENEMVAADLAQSTKKAIDEYNRLFKQKINYGLSAECGEIIIKKTGDSISFAGLGNFIINAKRLASFSQGDVFIGEKLKEKIQSNAKLEKYNSDGGPHYILKELRDKERHQKFLNSFVKRWERDNKIAREPPKKEEIKEKDDGYLEL